MRGALAALALAPGGPPDRSAFVGAYLCPQGSTGMTLQIGAWPDARFKFFPTAGSAHNCSGEFRMRGGWLNDTQTLVFRPVTSNAWIHNTCDYDTVGLHGRFSHHGVRLDGKIDHVECSKFSLIKAGASSTGCVDADDGATDARGRACRHYVEHPHWCTAWDSSGFDSAAMCCACGGGVQGGVAPSMCFDWTDQVTDTLGNTCSWYRGHSGQCGKYDDATFTAGLMCCMCGGGVEVASQDMRTGAAANLSSAVPAPPGAAQALAASRRNHVDRMDGLRRSAEKQAMDLLGHNHELQNKNEILLSELQAVQAELESYTQPRGKSQAAYLELQAAYSRTRMFLLVACVVNGLGMVSIAFLVFGCEASHKARDIGHAFQYPQQADDDRWGYQE